MTRRLFLLDGMALVYRAHFALIARPILTSKGVNTSALYGFTQTLLDIINKQEPSHLGVAFDTAAPTQRHTHFAEYKATREEMPEDLAAALPHVRRMLEAFRVPVLTCDGYEADDLIATLVSRAEKEGYECFMVTPDKDFGQLVTEKVRIYKPGRMGDSAEILGPAEVRQRWGIKNPGQVVDILALMGDTSDNIPGVPGIGEKTAAKLISEFGSLDNLLAHTAGLKARVKETLEKHRELALLSRNLATLICDAPCDVSLDSLAVQPPDEEKLKAILIEFEFNSIGKRLFGEGFRAGRGFQAPPPPAQAETTRATALELNFGPSAEPAAGPVAPGVPLKRLTDVDHEYQLARTAEERSALIKRLENAPHLCIALVADRPDVRSARIVGLAISSGPHSGCCVLLPEPAAVARAVLAEFTPLLESPRITKTGHDLKFDLALLRRQGIKVGGALFDTMVAHSLIEPEMRHSIGYLAEAFLGYTPLAAPKWGGSETQAAGLAVPAPDELARFGSERADLALQLRGLLEPLLTQKKQEGVFYQIEMPLLPVLVEMEYEGIRVDAQALTQFSTQLAKEIDVLEKAICAMAGSTFNLNSPKQLGQVLFEVLKICDAPKKTRTGQYATDEQTLMALAPDHEIVRQLLEHRVLSKLKSTYADALPATIWPVTGRVHTTFNQVATATGRLNSQDPNLQNIPIRTERGQEIRKAFVPRDAGHVLLSADYSQIELRIIAALSRETGLLEAFRTGADVHTATAARVFGVSSEAVTSEMRRQAKMVNYGIAYGISAFGLAQRLGIPRKEAAEIIDQYFRQFSGIRHYMDRTIAFARRHGYVETVSGRRRYLRDITSSNNTVRAAAERNAINAPIQGTAADMIKIAMIHIQREIDQRGLKTRMLLQVHDELVFDLYKPEETIVRQFVEERMKAALPLEVPIVVEIGTGTTWLDAH